MIGMKITEPLLFLSDVLHVARDTLHTRPLPDWLNWEMQNRLVLLLNHLLKQNRQAQERLLTQKDKVVHVHWQNRQMPLHITPAGLFMPADADAKPDLVVRVEETSTWQLANQLMRAQQPQIHISGDAQLAATINWLTTHVRWNGEADLARLIGADAAQQIAAVLRPLHQALQSFVDVATRKMAGSVDGSSRAGKHAPHTGSAAGFGQE